MTPDQAQQLAAAVARGDLVTVLAWAVVALLAIVTVLVGSIMRDRRKQTEDARAALAAAVSRADCDKRHDDEERRREREADIRREAAAEATARARQASEEAALVRAALARSQGGRDDD